MSHCSPHIVGVSSFIDNNVRSQAQESGFHKVYDIPLTRDDIVESIVPELSERISEMKHFSEIA